MEELLDLLNRKDTLTDQKDKDRLKELMGGIGYLHNEEIRTTLLKEYGGTWPPLEEDISSKVNKGNLYVQAYVAVAKNGKYDGKIIYAGKSDVTKGTEPWNAYAIYNPANDTWYKRIDNRPENLAGLYHAEPGEVDKIITSLSDTNKWTPIN